MPGAGFGKNADGHLPPVLPLVGRRGAIVELFVDIEELADLPDDMARKVNEVVDVLVGRVTQSDAEQLGLASGASADPRHPDDSGRDPDARIGRLIEQHQGVQGLPVLPYRPWHESVVGGKGDRAQARVPQL